MPDCNQSCKHDGEIANLRVNNEQNQKTLEAVSTKLDLILAQITKVAVLEEKHSNQSLDLARAYSRIERLEKEVEDLAKETRAYIAYSQGRDKVLWAIGSAVLLLGIKVLFFAAAHGMTN